MLGAAIVFLYVLASTCYEFQCSFSMSSNFREKLWQKHLFLTFQLNKGYDVFKLEFFQGLSQNCFVPQSFHICVDIDLAICNKFNKQKRNILSSQLFLFFLQTRKQTACFRSVNQKIRRPKVLRQPCLENKSVNHLCLCPPFGWSSRWKFCPRLPTVLATMNNTGSTFGIYTATHSL